VVAVVRVDDLDELMMITARGKIQRVRVSDVRLIGRNTQGVRIMSLDDDTLVAVKCVPREEGEEEAAEEAAADEARPARAAADEASPPEVSPGGQAGPAAEKAEE
jgi:DNA gyrase subunit A